MDRAAAITEIKRGLGFRTTQDSIIIAKLKQAQVELELGVTLPNFLISYDTEIAVTADVATATLPARFIRFHDDYQMYYLNSSDKKVFLPKRSYTEAYEAYVGSGFATDDGDVSNNLVEGYPRVIVQRGKTEIELIPTPTVGFTAYLTCYVGAEILDTNIENAWLENAPYTLIGRAGMSVAGILRDKDALAEFGRMAQTGRAGLLGDIIEDELAGRPLIMGRNN